MTWKENTPFKDSASYRLDARIEADSDDNRKNAIQYILLHELGHALTVGTDIHPPWNIPPQGSPGWREIFVLRFVVEHRSKGGQVSEPVRCEVPAAHEHRVLLRREARRG